MRRARWSWLLLGAWLLSGARASAAELTVFAAASLADVLPALADVYAHDRADRIRCSFAASSALARQLEAGASADVFISADEDWMDYALERELLVPDTRAIVAGNRLVLIGRRGAPRIVIDDALPLAKMLGDGRLALGDPAHVPAGRYAQQALEKLGLWSSVAARLVPAESVRVAQMYVVRGEAPLAIVYATDVRGIDDVQVMGEFPPASHPPIHYPAAALAASAAPAAARAFVAWLGSAAAAAVWRRYGFISVATP